MSFHLIHSPKSKRIERKIILKKGQSIFMLQHLKILGFNRTYPNRKISSIYFDDFELNALRDNIDGNQNRNKIRIRYYNDILSNSVIELKQKRGFIGYKTKFKFSEHINNYDELINASKEKLFKTFNKQLRPVSKVSYFREYYLKNHIRATIDTKITAVKVSSNGKNLITSLNDYEVIEFKYESCHDSYFREFFHSFNNFYLRTTKSSKYSNSLMY